MTVYVGAATIAFRRPWRGDDIREGDLLIWQNVGGLWEVYRGRQDPVDFWERPELLPKNWIVA